MRQADELLTGIGAGVLDLETGPLQVQLPGLGKVRGGSPERDRDVVGPLLEVRLGGVAGIGLAGPAVAKQHPRAGTPGERDMPAGLPPGYHVRRLAAERYPRLLDAEDVLEGGR